MTSSKHPRDLPLELDARVRRALSRREGHDEAIEAIEAYLEAGGERSPAVLMALATLTYEDAACLVLSRLREASEEALALVDEALAHPDGPRDELRRMRELFGQTLAQEQQRERDLRLRATNPSIRPTELAQLAHGLMLRGEDGLAQQLFRAADQADAERQAAEAEAFGRDQSGIVRIRRSGTY